MDHKIDQQEISSMIQNCLLYFCKSSLKYKMGFTIEGMLQVTIDTKQPFTININKSVGNVSHICKLPLKKEMIHGVYGPRSNIDKIGRS